MPNTKSAIRRTKRSLVQTSVNKIRKSKYKATVKKMNAYIEAGKIKEAKAFLPKFHSQLMKIAKSGVVRRETVSRKISRATRRIKNLKK